MPETPEFNYVTANRFYIEMESEITASFSECSGLGMTLAYETYIEGGVNDQQRIILGDPKFSEVTLKRGMTDSLVFWEWIRGLFEGKNSAGDKTHQRRNVSILLFNQAGETMQSWTLVGAIPVGWKAGALQASSESVVLEELTLAYEGLRAEKNAGRGFSEHHGGRHETGYFTGDS